MKVDESWEARVCMRVEMQNLWNVYVGIVHISVFIYPMYCKLIFQTFVRLMNTKTNQEIFFVAEHEASKVYKFDLVCKHF
jgi:hypothetical protein